MFSRTEAEEEGLVNKLISRLSELKKEKVALAIEVEREEEVRRRVSWRKATCLISPFAVVSTFCLCTDD